MYRVKIVCIGITEQGFNINLSETEDGPRLHINIGLTEAQLISLHLTGEESLRPLSADLTLKILDDLDATLKKSVIYEMRDGIYYANLHVETLSGKLLIIDCRPSDALILGLKENAPIYISEKLMNQHGSHPAKSQINTSLTQDLSPPEILARRLHRAVDEEDFEEAAFLRDKISNLKARHHRI